jgi:hypothetical protein
VYGDLRACENTNLNLIQSRAEIRIIATAFKRKV